MTKAKVYTYTSLLFLGILVVVLWLTGGDFGTGIELYVSIFFFFAIFLTSLAAGLAGAGDKHLAPYKERISSFLIATGAIISFMVFFDLAFHLWG